MCMMIKKRSLLCAGLILGMLLSACSMPKRLAQITGRIYLAETADGSLKETRLENACATEVKTRSAGSEEDQHPEETAAQSQQHIDERAEEILAGMTIEEKIAQLFILTPDALRGDGDTITVYDDAFAACFNEMPVGGFILMGENLTGAEQTRTLISHIQMQSMERSALPSLICVDEEGGTVARVSGSGLYDVPMTENMADIGAQGSKEEAKQVGITIGTYLRDLGFNVDLAPVADVLTNPDNTVVYDRSFGSDPALVSEMSAAVSEGLRSCGILSTYKHFPGHGATEADTHAGYAYTMKTWRELSEAELVPFIAGVEDRVPLMMVGHIALPAVTGDDTPASLSSVIITDHLINEMGYEGLIVTDALNMGAVTERYTSSEAALEALLAGNDLLLMPADFQAAYEGLMAAVENGSLSEERIDHSLRKIITVKLSLMAQ